jgi:hypothetical protein
MISFFRRLRQRLLNENSLSKYLLYATGEILLVVIGILIALQINTWNEERIGRRVEDSFFKDLLLDLEKDEEKLLFYEEFHARRIEYLDTLLTYVRDPNRSMALEKFGRYVEPLFYSVNPVSNATTFESAKTSGTFNTFTQKEILKDLSQYYADFMVLEYAFSSILRFVENHFEPLMYSLPENYMTEDTGNLVINEVDVTDFYRKVASIKDYRNIKADHETILRKPIMENYLIGDMGRSYNALGKIASRKQHLKSLREKITSL